MFSTLLELLGFAAFVAATYLIFGLAGALYVGGGLLLVVGYAVDDEASAGTIVTKVTASARSRVQALRSKHAAKKA